jgi:hypothetical protein
MESCGLYRLDFVGFYALEAVWIWLDPKTSLWRVSLCSRQFLQAISVEPDSGRVAEGEAHFVLTSTHSRTSMLPV